MIQKQHVVTHLPGEEIPFHGCETLKVLEKKTEKNQVPR